MTRPLVVDGHLDIAMNALRQNRDQLKSVAELRERERTMMAEGPLTPDAKGRGVNTVSLPEMQAGNVFLGFATVIARTAHETNDYGGHDGQEICYAAARGQLAYYELLESRGDLRILRDWGAVREHREEWEEADGDDAPPVGIVLAMEGADPIVDPGMVEEWYERGLRLVGLAHYGRSSYADGTGCEGGLTDRGPALLSAMDEAGMVLDLTHLADRAFWEALENFSGLVHASHCNCRALVSGDRQLPDDQIEAIVDRDGVIGVAMDAWMLQEGWEKGVYNQVTATMETVADHVEHICEIAGDTRHVAIGSDLDGGYGLEQVPRDLDTIADLQKLAAILESRGYDEDDVARITHGNWLRLLEDAL